MLMLSGYKVIEKISNNEEIAIFRVVRLEDQEILLAKTTNTRYVDAATITLFQHEFKQFLTLQGEGVIEPISLEIVDGRPILLFQNLEGFNLQQFNLMTKKYISLKDKLTIAIALVECIQQLHENKIMMNEMIPLYFFVTENLTKAKLIDIRFAQLKNQVGVYSISARKVDSLFAYVSPEKIEHTSIPYDYRADFYSIGVILYEIFVGHLPYESESILDMMYHHIATVQKPAYLENTSIPNMISSIIDKCMEKTTEVRYGSMVSLKADLEECYRQIQAEGDIQPFLLAKREIVADWFTQQKLFGRKQEQQQIVDVLTSVRQGKSGLISVSGEAGIGKTYFVENTLHQHMLSSEIYISIRCKQKNIQRFYSILEQIIEKLVAYLLTEPQDQLALWKQKLSDVVQGDEEILVGHFPSLQLLIGEQVQQQVVLELDYEQNLYNFTADFLKLFTEKAHTCVIFLDNFDLADEQFVNYLQFLLYTHQIKGFLVITAYRTNTTIYLPIIKKTTPSIIVQHIKLDNYDANTVAQLLHPRLNGVKKEQQMLIQLLLKKTAGNPLRMQQFLEEIVEKELVTVDLSKEGWLWDLQGIADLSGKENTGILFDAFFKYVDNPTSRLLSKAAFLGSQFKLQLLAEMTSSTVKELQETLQVAINYQLIYNVSNDQQLYAFQHEEVRQEFYQRVNEQDKDVLHMDAGQALAKHIEKDSSITIAQILQHFNEVKKQMIARGKQLELIKLNFEAAMQEDNHNRAIYYLQNAITLITNEHWQEHYEMTYNIYKQRAELAFLNEQYEKVKAVCDIIIENSKTDVDKVQAYILLMQLELSNDHYDEVLVLGEIALQQLNLPIKLEIGKLKERYYWLRIYRKLGKKPSQEILNLPPMQCERNKAAARVLVYMANACFVSSREGWYMTVVTLLDLTFEDGLTSESAYGFAGYALIQCSLAFQYESAFHYSKFASNLVKDHPEMFMQVNTIITMCQDSWRRYEPDFLLSISDYTNQNGVLSNNRWQTNYSFIVNCAHLFNFSYPLKDLYAHLLSRSSLFRDDYDSVLWKYATIMSLLLTKLTGYTAAHDPFIYEKSEKNSRDEDDSLLLEYYWWCEYITGYLFGHYIEAYEAIMHCVTFDQSRDNPGLQNPSIDYFYVLIVKELFSSADTRTRSQYMQQIRRSIKKLKRLAKRCPDNYLHKYLVVKAEYSKIIGCPKYKIEAVYEQAIEVAHQYGHLHDIGIISECFAKYSIEIGKNMQAKVYINEAYIAFQKWGALAKLAQLEQEYGDLLLVKKTSDLERVDYLTIVSSTQALSDEIEINQLLYKLLRIMLQNAGAEYGALIFDNNGEWFLEAYGTTENLIVQSIPFDEASDFVPAAIIDYTVRMKEEVVLHDATNSGFGRNQYIQQHDLKSVLCLPIMYQNKLLSVLYMENNLSKGVFTEERLDVLKFLCSQCAISITNAKLYSGIQYLTKNLEQQVEERTKSLKKSMQMTSDALTEMTVYAERNRIAQEIHDIVGHTLTSTILQIEAGRRLLTKDMNGATKRLKDAQDLVRHSLNEIRNSVHMLKEDKYFDVKQALSLLIKDTEWNTGVVIYANMDMVDHLPVIMKKLIYHALQEGLTNGIRHGQSNEFHFTLKDNGLAVIFELVDNGIGAEELKMGFGLGMMKDRVEQLKGTLSISTVRDKGCSLSITLPYIM
ncbi:AAA family ATPase [Lysinibacillus sp. NPDC047702]|uniref:AAA family ATPase n=1 Tax=unclassified Lysinibacillus TaxID=2636778 RepID=UPI003CFD921B